MLKNFLFLIILCNIIFQSEFGKNIVQYKNFEWYYTQTKHFDIYVSDSTGYHLNFLEQYSEDAYNKIQDLFDWSLKDKNNKFTRFNNIDPLDFYRKFTKIKLKNKVCLIHAPMSNKKMNELYTIDFLGNVVGGNIIKYANVEINELKKAAIKSIKNDEAVWFGCDVGKMFNRELGIMDMDLYDYEKLFDTKFKMNKASRLEYGDSAMTHAMLFTGVDLKRNTPRKWRVENSWGDKNGDKGYYLMSDSWFDEYNYEVVVDKKYLSSKILEIFNREPNYLEPWDPMGALAVS